MKQREKVLTIVTVAVVGLLLAYQFIFAGMIESASGGTGDLATARQTMEQNLDTIADAARIEREYKAFEVELPERITGQSSRETFSNELANLLESQKTKPAMDPPTFDVIPNVDDYFFMEIQVRLTGSLPEMINVLRAMDQRGLLIKSFKLVYQSGNKINLTANVRRLVKHDEDSRKWVRGRR